jgi:hypothetical protein
MSDLEQIKLFSLNNLAIEAAIRKAEKDIGVPLRNESLDADRDQDFYPQFPEKIRREAANMALHYELFYCLEVSIRQLVVETLKEQDGVDWWTKLVPQDVRDNAEKNRERESATGMTPRSENMIDYTTFGELNQIIIKNPQLFGETFRDMRAVTRILSALNNIRGPIAHCCPLAEDEVSRLQLSLKDWFRQMG